MRQVLQSLRNGQIELVDVPAPEVRPGHLLIRSGVSLISAGTERMLLQFGKAGLLKKAQQQPERVRQVIQKARTDGLAPTFNAVRSKLDQPLAVGYCNVGTVLAVGAGVTGFEPGDRVVSNGSHAEVVCIPRNLCVKIPENVSDSTAAFTILGAIGLQGIRLAAPTLGESFVVTGLGLIGLLTVQLLKAQGCRVLGIDFDPARVELARSYGAEGFDLSAGGDPVAAGMKFSRGRGVDGVLVTASTKSNEPIQQAAQMCRKRGRIVLVGVTGTELSRADFYEKELSFQVSCSYGPGRYDADYEANGHDYPLGFVRWTEQRNFEAVLDVMSTGAIDVEPLITGRFDHADAEAAYETIGNGPSALGVLLDYPTSEDVTEQELLRRTIVATPADEALTKTRSHSQSQAAAPILGILGAGNFAAQVLIPAFQQCDAELAIVGSRNGLSSTLAARKFGFRESTTDLDHVFANSDVNTVVIATRHDSHAEFVCRALKNGKHTFIEKPLALTQTELDRIVDTHAEAVNAGNTPLLMVGFNRRFAAHTQQIVKLLREVNAPKSFVMTVNAGEIPADHWVHDPAIGGGRIIGEGCHFIDLLRYLCGSPIISVQATTFGPHADQRQLGDVMSFTLEFADGSFGTVHYLANGHRGVPKERLEIFSAGRVIQLDNFRKLRAYGWKQFRKLNLWQMDKGHKAGARAFVDAIRHGQPAPIPLAELIEVTQVSFDVLEAAKTGRRVDCTRNRQFDNDQPLTTERNETPDIPDLRVA